MSTFQISGGGGRGLVAGGREDGRIFFVLSCVTSVDYIILFSISGSPAIRRFHRLRFRYWRFRTCESSGATFSVAGGG